MHKCIYGGLRNSTLIVHLPSTQQTQNGSGIPCGPASLLGELSVTQKQNKCIYVYAYICIYLGESSYADHGYVFNDHS